MITFSILFYLFFYLMTGPIWVGTVQIFQANWLLQKIKQESKKKV